MRQEAAAEPELLLLDDEVEVDELEELVEESDVELEAEPEAGTLDEEPLRLSVR